MALTPRGYQAEGRARGAANVVLAMSGRRSCVERVRFPALDAAAQTKTAEILPSDVLSGILGWALSVSDLYQLSIVCSRWLHASRSASSWTGHQIDIVCMSIRGQELQRWWPIWKLANIVVLTYSQLDAFNPANKRAYPTSYIVRHVWGRWPALEVCDEWHDIRLGGARWLVKLTKQKAPDTVGILQGWSRYLKTSLILGWTTASSPKSLSRLWSSRDHRRQDLEGELISVRLCQRSLLRTQGANDATPGEALRIHLVRESRTVALQTFADGHVTLQRRPLEEPVAPHRCLRFFIAMPRPVGGSMHRLPRAALQPDCSVPEP